MVEMEKVLSKDFIPKKDTQQEEFLQKYPNYDGRGIKIAIIDTGVDVSLDGLQKTSTGLPKIIDCFDFTGAGAVDTSKVKKIGKSRILTLLSGRNVKIPQNWKNPSNKWHLGIKSIFEILPPNFREGKNKTDNEKFVQFNENVNVQQPKDIETEKQFLTDYKVDFIVWYNGQIWQTYIISPENETLETAKILTNFRDSHEYCFVFEKVACCITIHNDGNLLELFIPHHYHGSCVAQVAAAHFLGQPEKDGIAPGAQIISINLLHQNANINTLRNALFKCIEMGVDIVNFSVGSIYFNEISILSLLEQMVNEYGIIIIKNAGNAGPFISSICEGNNEEIIYIGSVFTQNVNSIFIKDVEDYPPFIWNYSSRGPSCNGSRGVTCVAPADAIVENPKWNSKKKRIFDGTSCAAPNAAGAIACLLSGLKANSIPYTPATVKMALSNTAFLPDGGDRLGFGNGIIQISSAFEYFKTYRTNLPRIIFPQIFLNGTNLNGIVLYKTKNDSLYNYYSINVENGGKRIPWILKSSSSKNHIEHSKTVENNFFNVKINASNLSPGNVYYSEIHGFHPLNPTMGPIFHFPITVIIPENVENYCIQKEIFVQPPSIFSHFIDPPKDAIKCTVKIIDPENSDIKFEKMLDKYEHVYGKHYSFKPNETKYEWKIGIKWNQSFETCIFQKIFIQKSFEFKADLQICFDQNYTAEEK